MKIKKIPFDLERAKKGEAFRIDDDSYDCFYISDYKNNIWMHYTNDKGITRHCTDTIKDSWHHLIPDEPKAERWAVVYNMDIHNSKEEAEFHRNGSTSHTVVKLADNED